MYDINTSLFCISNYYFIKRIDKFTLWLEVQSVFELKHKTKYSVLKKNVMLFLLELNLILL